jgi:hypothetical protein
MDKRAGYAQPIIDAAVTVLIILIFIIFYILFSLQAQTRSYAIKDQASVVDGGVILFTFLSQPVDYGGQKMTMGEMLGRVDYSKRTAGPGNYVGTVQQAMLKYMDNYYKETGCPIRMVVIAPEITDEQSIKGDVKGSCKTYLQYYQASQIIPRLDGKTLTIEVYAGVKS